MVVYLIIALSVIYC